MLRTPNRINAEKTTCSHITIKLPKTKDEKKNLKSSQLIIKQYILPSKEQIKAK